jgi:putative ABC transport system permease protein
VIRSALYNGLLPTLNQMAAAGIITLPGIMTGQILAGMDPLDAARYQILLMFLLAAAGFLAALGAVYLTVWRLTDSRDRLRLDRPARAATLSQAAALDMLRACLCLEPLP